jgi:hypothetical protein
MSGFFSLRRRAFLHRTRCSRYSLQAAVVPLLVPAPYALDHDEALGADDLLILCSDLFLQLEMGQETLSSCP